MTEITASEAQRALDSAVDLAKTSALYQALGKAQGMMGAAGKDRENPHMKYRYATLASVIDALREPFAANGLCHWSIPSMDLDAGLVRVDVFIGHVDGGVLHAPMSAKLGDSKGLSAIQAQGVLITYMRRYGLMALAGISSADDDTDGAGDKKTPPKEQPPPFPPPAPAFDKEAEQTLVALAVSSLRSAKSGEDIHKVRVILNAEKGKLGPVAAQAVRAELDAAIKRVDGLTYSQKLEVLDPSAANDIPSMGQ